MHALEHTRLAAALTQFAAVPDQASSNLGDASHAFWLAQRFRCDQWHHAISEHRSRIGSCGTARRIQSWNGIRPVLEEILLSEPLIRVTAYLSDRFESCGVESDWAPLAYSALANQKEARNRCLNLIVFGQGLPVEHAVNLNRLRRMVEMVSDQLISLLPTCEDLSEYAFDAATVNAEQATLAGQSLLSPHAQFRSQVLSSSLVSAAAHALSPQVASPRLNQELAEAVTAMFPSVCFDDFGLISGPMHRISSATIAEQDIDFSDLTRPVPAPYSLLGTPERPSRTSPHNRRLN